MNTLRKKTEKELNKMLNETYIEYAKAALSKKFFMRKTIARLKTVMKEKKDMRELSVEKK